MVGCTLVCRIVLCCVVAGCVVPVREDDVEFAAVARVVTLWVLVVLVGRVVAITVPIWVRAPVGVALEWWFATSGAITHCCGKVAVRIGACRLMGRMSSSKQECGKRINPPGGTRNLSGSMVCEKYSRPSSMIAQMICRQRSGVKFAQHSVTRSQLRQV